MTQIFDRLALLLLIAAFACRAGSDEPVPRQRRDGGRPPAVLVIGIDGADWYVIRQLVRDGALPTIAGLMAGGAWGDLQTISPTESPAIWTTLATGYEPKRHGITGFTATVPGSGATTLVSSTNRREDAIWNLASDAGVRVGVVNWWATFPAEAVDGFVVSDRANLRRRFAFQSFLGLTDPRLRRVGEGETHPPDLLPRILDAVGANGDVPPLPQRLLFEPLPSALRAEAAGYERMLRDRRLSVLKFVALHDHAAVTAARVAAEVSGAPQLLLAYLSGLDAAEHQFWAYYEPHRYPHPPAAEEVRALQHVIPAYYRYVDALISDLLRLAPADATILLMSDHGHDANLYWDPAATIGDYAKWSMGNHGNAPPGIFLLSGPGVQPGQTRRVSVYDVAPTLLALLGVPPTLDMPGRVISEAFTPARQRSLRRDRVARPRPQRPAGAPVAAELDAQLLEKLRALGYIR